MDGVIVDSNPLHEEAEALTFSKFGMDVPAEEWRHFKGRTAQEIFRYVIEKYGSSKLDAEQLIKYKTELFLDLAEERIELITGSDGFIRKAKKRYERLGLTTSAEMSVVGASLARFGLVGVFDIIVTGDDITQGKPHPEPYLLTLEKLGASAKRTIVIEDADNGIVSAKHAGCYAAGITTTLTRADLLAAGADIVVNSFEELSKALGL